MTREKTGYMTGQQTRQMPVVYGEVLCYATPYQYSRSGQALCYQNRELFALQIRPYNQDYTE